MVMPFGLTNAPATFPSFMNTIFAALLRKGVLVFMDYILIYSSSLEEHVKLLREVFIILQQNHLLIKRSKCSFDQRSVEYLGHVVSAQGVSTDPARIKAVNQWPVPSNIK